MSLLEYLKERSKFDIKLSTESYQDKLKADLSSLVIKPNDELIEVKKYIVNMLETSQKLSEMNYPFTDEFNIVVKTANLNKVKELRNSFKEWARNHNKNKDIVFKIESDLLKYERSLLDDFLNPDEVDFIYESFISESNFILDKIVSHVRSTINSMKTWGNYKMKIESLFPQSGWISNEAKITIGDSFLVEFVINYTPLKMEVKNLRKENLPQRMESDINNLLDKLKNNVKINKLLTLYLNRPISDSNLLEMAKRDLSLGIQAALPSHFVFKNKIDFEDENVWKIKIEEKYLKKSLQNDDYVEYQCLGDDIPIKWIEKIKKENK